MKYFFGFLASVGLIIAVFILIVHGFSGGPKTPTTAPLTDYTNTNVQMRFTIDGPINADQSHRAVRITIDQNQAMIQLLNGYGQSVADQHTYSSNTTAYGNFLRALDLVGFTHGTTTATTQDERGYCPSGSRYNFDIVDGANVKQHFWNTSCGGAGNFRGNTKAVTTLFEAQIPDFGNLNYKLN